MGHRRRPGRAGRPRIGNVSSGTASLTWGKDPDPQFIPGRPQWGELDQPRQLVESQKHPWSAPSALPTASMRFFIWAVERFTASIPDAVSTAPSFCLCSPVR